MTLASYTIPQLIVHAQTPTEVSCINTIDDDNDGDTDCADPDCLAHFLCKEKEEGSYCSDLFDNDGDGNIDCADEGCAESEECKKVTPTPTPEPTPGTGNNSGWTTPLPPVEPSENCGNFIVETGETCDDGWRRNGDGCNSLCQREKPSCDVAWFYGIGKEAHYVTIQSANIKNKSRITLTDIDRGDQGNRVTQPQLPIAYHYKNEWEYKATIQLKNSFNKNTLSICEIDLFIRGKYGCTDPYAINHNEEAEINDGSCRYNEAKDIKCSDIHFRTNNNKPLTNELIYFSRSQPYNTSNVTFYPGTWEKVSDIGSPFSFLFQEAWIYQAQLILTDQKGQTTACNEKIYVWKTWCTNKKADNYNPEAERNDGSCVVTPGQGHVKIVTKNPYQKNNILNGHIQFNGNEKQIEVTIQLAQYWNVIYEFSPRVNRNWSFQQNIHVSNTNSENQVIPWNYDLIYRVSHYKGAKDFKQFKISIADPRHASASRCGDKVIHPEEECDGSLYCNRKCEIQGLSKKQKAAVEKIADQTIQNRLSQTTRTALEKRFETIENYLNTKKIQGSYVQIYTLNYLAKNILNNLNGNNQFIATTQSYHLNNRQQKKKRTAAIVILSLTIISYILWNISNYKTRKRRHLKK